MNGGPAACHAAKDGREQLNNNQKEGSTMIALLKAVPFGIALTLIVALFIGSGGSTGGFLSIRSFDVDIAQLGIDMKLYWSWALFLGGTGLTWALMLMIGD